MASVAATITVARTNWVSDTQATRPDPSTSTRLARGESRDEPRPDALAVGQEEEGREQHDEEARQHVPEGGADLADVGEQRPVLDEVVEGLLGAVEVVVDLAVTGVQRAVLEPVGDLGEALGHRVGEVLRTVGDLVARDGQEGHHRGDDQDDHQPGRRPARDAAAVHRADHRLDQGGDEQGHDDGQHDHHEVAEHPDDDVSRRGDDQEPPGPGGSEVDAPRDVGPGEVGPAAGHRLPHPRRLRLRPPLGPDLGQVVPLLGDAPGQPLAGALPVLTGRRDHPDRHVGLRLVSAVAHADRLVRWSASRRTSR